MKSKRTPLIWWAVGTGALASVIVIVLMCSAGAFGTRLAHYPRVSLIESGAITWYEVSATAASPKGHPAGYDGASANIIAIAPALASGAIPALANPSAAGASLGIVSGGAFTERLSPALRYDLSSDGKGTAYYLETSSSTSHLYGLAIEDASAAPVDLGPASAASAAPGGSVVAATPEGIVRIMPDASSAPVTLVPLPASGTMYFAAVAPGASSAAYWDKDAKELKLYNLAGEGGPALAASIPLSIVQPDAVAFAPSGDLVVRTGDTLTFYSAQNGAAEKAVTITAQ